MNVAASRDVRNWNIPILACLTGKMPWAYLAPEIIEHAGQFYIAAYKYNETHNGICMAHLAWE